MKKLFALVFTISSLLACNSSKKEKTISVSNPTEHLDVNDVVDVKDEEKTISLEPDTVIDTIRNNQQEILIEKTISKAVEEKTKNESQKILSPEVQKNDVAPKPKNETVILDTTSKIVSVDKIEVVKEQLPEKTSEAVKEPQEEKSKIVSKEDLEVVLKFDHKPWTTFLKKHVNSNGDVNYGTIKNDESELKAYLNQFIKKAPENSWSKNEKLAYWINAYNAFTIKLIVDNYPLKSIRDIEMPWDKKFIPIGGELLSLNHIEHEILRKMNEPRIHFAINCASASCPKLINEAFEPNTLEQQLNKVSRNFINNQKKNQIQKDEIKISKIFKWFNKDFEKKGTIIDFLNQFSETTIAPNAKIGYLEYDWKLNKQ